MVDPALFRASRTSAACRSPSSGSCRRSGRSAASCSARSGPWQKARISSSVQAARPGLMIQAHSSSPSASSGTPNTCTSLHLGVAVQELLDLARVDVLAAADHHVLDAADDVAVALVVDGGQVAGVHPAVGVDGLGGLFLVVPVAEHHRIAARAQLALGRAARCGPRCRRSSPRGAAGCGPRWTRALQRVVGAALEAHRRGLGHAVGDGDLAHVHLAAITRFMTSIGHGAPAMMPVRRRTGRSGEARMVELGDEHRGHAVAAPVQRFLRHGSSVASGSKPSPGKTMVAPWVTQPGCPSPCRSSGTAAPGCTAGR
jgi:hypothetical protein